MGMRKIDPLLPFESAHERAGSARKRSLRPGFMTINGERQVAQPRGRSGDFGRPRGKSRERDHPIRARSHRKPMLTGYARVSTADQNLALQRDALTEAGCAKIFTEQMSGAVTDRPALHDALEFARSGDTLIVWKLDRLARSMKQLIETIETLRLRGIGFRSLTEALDTTDRAGAAGFFSHVRHTGGIRAQSDP
jgi:hypothetical protein